MIIMKRTARYLLAAASLSLATSGFSADMKFIQGKGGKIVEVPAESVQATCGKDFAFRERDIDKAPKYLKKEAVLATFGGKLLPNLKAVKEELQGSDGTCSWVSAAELSDVMK